MNRNYMVSGGREAELKRELEELERMKIVSVVEYPDVKRNPKGEVTGVRDTENNAKALFDYLGVSIRYNEMSKDIEIAISGNEFSDDTKANSQLAWLKAKARYHNMPDANMSDYVEMFANRNSYHPVRDWIDSKPWDGVDRVDTWLDTITSNHPLKNTLMRKWALSAAAALYEKEFSTEGILIFIGKQGIGKTRWLSSLVKERKWTKDGVLLDPKNKDSVLQAVSCWIAELGELPSTFRKADIDQLKAFITQTRDDIRPAYAARANRYRRQTVFFGTSNDSELLTDDENRRFWPLEVISIDYEHGIDMQQFWAQMKAQYAGGSMRFLTADERTQLYSHQEATNRHISPVEERMERRCSQPPKTAKELGVYKKNATTILMECGLSNPTVKDVKIASRWLKTNGYEKDSRREYAVVISIA